MENALWGGDVGARLKYEDHGGVAGCGFGASENRGDCAQDHAQAADPEWIAEGAAKFLGGAGGESASRGVVEGSGERSLGGREG